MCYTHRHDGIPLRRSNMNKIKLFHNPRCSKSRAARALLEARGVVIDIVEYLESPPTVSQLRAIVKKLGVRALDIVRTGEPLFRDMGLSTRDERSDEEWLRIVAENPTLLQRPIIVDGERAVIGRPTENIFGILRP